MQPRRFTHPLLRGACAAVLAAASLLAACEAKVPTSADIDGLDARKAEQSAAAFHVIPDSATRWMVDDAEVSATSARAIPSDSIATVNIHKLPSGALIAIRTRRSAMASALTRSGESPVASADGKAKAISTTAPIVFIDGVRSDMAALKKLDRSRVANVDMVKGKYAQALYGADALGGAIVVKTK
jgi:outer membrane receptor protein involved in Fe transport